MSNDRAGELNYGSTSVSTIASYFQGGDDEIAVGHDCSTCTSADDGSCKLHCLMEERKKKECAEPHTSL